MVDSVILVYVFYVYRLTIAVLPTAFSPIITILKATGLGDCDGTYDFVFFLFILSYYYITIMPVKTKTANSNQIHH